MGNGRRRPGAAILAFVFVTIPLVVMADETVHVIGDPNSARISVNGAPACRCRLDDVPFKPYVDELYTPAGLNVLLDAPPDHLHHHGLMLACAVDRVDFWAEGPPNAVGKQVHKRLLELAVSERRGQFTQTLDWVGPTNERLLTERRTLCVHRVGGSPASVTTWVSELAVPPGGRSVTLSGSHYHGLGMRFVRSMDATGEFRNADQHPGVVFRGDERLVRSDWCAYTAEVEGQPVTVAMFGYPDNPRHPTTWFTMARPFAYLSATLRLHEEPLTLAPEKRLRLCYGVALWDGRPEAGAIDALYADWVATRSQHVRRAGQ